MKRTRFAGLLCALLALTLCLAACGSSGYSATAASSAPAMPMPAASKGMANNYDAAPAEMDMVAMESGALAGGTARLETSEEVSEQSGEAADSERKIVYTGSMTLETKEFDEALAAVTKLVEEAGGYISSQAVSGVSMTYRGSYYERYANLTVRVPAAKFDSLMTGVSGVCNVTDRAVWTDDISERYYDAKVHLSTLELQEERLLEILSKADKLDDVITLEQALSDVRYQIESLTAQLRRMDSQVDFSTLTLVLNEVVEYSEIEEKPATFGEKLASAAKRSGQKIVTFFQELVLWVIEDLPLLLLWLVLLGFVLWIVLRTTKRFRKPNPNRRPLFGRKKQETPPPPAAGEGK